MKSRPYSLLVFAVLSCAFSVPSMAASISLDQYRQQLGGLKDRVNALCAHPEQAAAVESSLPDTVVVAASSVEITVNYHDLKNDLSVFARADAAKRGPLCSRIKSYVAELESQAAAYSETGADLDSAHRRLESILGRREFRHAQQQPGLISIIAAKIFSWIIRMLARLHFGSGRFDWLQIVIYVLVAAALATLLFWTIRRLRGRPEESEMREIIPFAPSARGWRAWLADALTFAQQKDWRSAIHLAYWAGISYLEEHGAWRPNRARTPREYLNLLTSRNANYSALSSLTRKFEVVWYGHRDARESDFEETLGQLEKLGCR